MIRHYTFGGPWEPGVFELDPEDAEVVSECGLPSVPCSVCQQAFEEGDKGVMTALPVLIATPDGPKPAVAVSATHRECYYWSVSACGSEWCGCEHPDVPIRDLALGLWKATAAQWN